jgi:hypothetical protein
MGHDRLGGIVEVEISGNPLRLGEAAASDLWVV